MMYYLKTKEECDKIVEKCEAFYRADRVVEGVNVAIYDYRLASISDFVDYEAFEMRGLCFVETDTGWERNILLQKFFNISQTSMDDLMEIELDNGDTIKVVETHKFQLDNGDTKIAKDLTTRDNILSYDQLTEVQ